MGPSASRVWIKRVQSGSSFWRFASIYTTAFTSKGWITAPVIIGKLDAGGGSTARRMKWTAKTSESGPPRASAIRTNGSPIKTSTVGR